MAELISKTKGQNGEGSEVSQQGKRSLEDAVEVGTAKKSRPNKETSKKTVAKKPQASKKGKGRAKASVEGIL